MENNRMEHPAEQGSELYDDEAVCFLADRYHTTPREVVRRFLAQELAERDPRKELSEGFRLEENEMELLRGLTAGIRS